MDSIADCLRGLHTLLLAAIPLIGDAWRWFRAWRVAVKQDKIMVTSSELAKRLGVCSATVRRMREEGRIPAVQLGPRTWRYDLKAALAAVGMVEQKSA